MVAEYRPVDDIITDVGVREAININFVASLLFTYRCSIACKHCLFNCSPWQPDMCTNTEDAIKFLHQLRATNRVIHIAGGEPMLYYDKLIEICRRARDEGCSPHFIETNAYWCIDDNNVVTRYNELRETGIKGMYISADPYHQAFIPPENTLRAYKYAVEVFGDKNVIGGNFSEQTLKEFKEIGSNEVLLGQYVRKNTPRLLGRAGESLAKFCDNKPLASLFCDHLWRHETLDGACWSEFNGDTMWEIHIDPYGNIQTCCGIIIGNANEKTLIEWMKNGFDTYHELIKFVMEEGPYGLTKIAQDLGFKPRDGYPQLCNFCWEVRKFLHPYFPDVFGPVEIYETRFSA